MLPPELRDPAQAEAVVVQAIRSLAQPSRPELEAFAAQAAPEIAAFIVRPDRLQVELRPRIPVAFDSRTAGADPLALLAAAAPRVADALPPRQALLPADLVSRVLATPEAATPEERRQVGIALATGQGAPRDLAQAATLIGDAPDDAEAAMALAEGLAGRDDHAAYAGAQAAAAAGAPGAPALLDSIEARIGLPAALQLQRSSAAPPAPDLAAIRTAADLRDRAAASLDGAGVPRDYAGAVYWATLGAAAGDAGSGLFLARIEGRMDRLLDPAPWRAARAAAEARALRDWVAADLPARLGVR